FAPKQYVTLPGVRQRLRPDAEIVGGEVSFEPFLPFHIIRSPRRRGRAAGAGRSATGRTCCPGQLGFHTVMIHYISLPCSHQKPMSTSRSIAVSVVKFSRACSGLPLRR